MIAKEFFIAEIGLYQPGGSSETVELTWGATPWASLALDPLPVEATGTLYVSDDGYTSLDGDAIGLVVYPPLISGGFEIDRTLDLVPGRTPASSSFGSIRIFDSNGQISSLMRTWNIFAQTLTVKRGVKEWDETRGYWPCPSYADLAPVFTGLSGTWTQTETEIVIPVNGATYWLDQPIQTELYDGTGTYEGNAALKGTPKPMTRGIVYNVAPVLIDPTNRIYQYNDGPGTVVALYERGATGITFQSDTTDLYAGSTSAGQYRTDNSRGLFQLGSDPVGTITVDATGEFLVAGAQTVAATIALYLLSEDLSVPSDFIDTSSFSSAASTYAYDAGVYFGPDDIPSGRDAVSRLLASFGASLIAKRTGELAILALRAPPAGSTSSFAFGQHNIISIEPVPLPPELIPPPYRIRVAYQHNHTVQNDVSDAATSAHRQFVAVPDRYSQFVDTDVLASYRRPNDLEPFGGALDDAADAETVAEDLGALWSVPRRTYAVEVPVSVGVGLDVGDLVRVTYPIDILRNGARGRIVREQFRSDQSITFLVLI
ncbi:MAG: hypothetical protein AB7F35_06360 [Acetobacteraceae bacterium]